MGISKSTTRVAWCLEACEPPGCDFVWLIKMTAQEIIDWRARDRVRPRHAQDRTSASLSVRLLIVTLLHLIYAFSLVLSASSDQDAETAGTPRLGGTCFPSLAPVDRAHAGLFLLRLRLCRRPISPAVTASACHLRRAPSSRTRLSCLDYGHVLSHVPPTAPTAIAALDSTSPVIHDASRLGLPTRLPRLICAPSDAPNHVVSLPSPSLLPSRLPCPLLAARPAPDVTPNSYLRSLTSSRQTSSAPTRATST